MVFKIRILPILMGCLLSFAGANSVFAEGDSECAGKITGLTVQNNPNSATTSFNAHPGAGLQDNKAVDLSIVNLANGLAPADREHAACVNKEAGNKYTFDYEYALKGWAWNTNLGFLSMNCKSGKNDAGLTDGLACGGIDYGVYVTGPVAGKRSIVGYAWSPNFGWMQFGYGWHAATSEWLPINHVKCKDATKCNDSTYLNADGTTTGYAWTEAGIYMDISGLKMDLPADSQVVVDDSSWCPKDFICVEPIPDPSKLKPTPAGYSGDGFDPGKDSDGDGIPDGQEDDDGDGTKNSQDPDFIQVNAGDVKIADGVDGYYLHLYLRDKNGNALEGQAGYNFKAFTDSIEFVWDDQVKLNQTDGSVLGDVLDDVKEPIKGKFVSGQTKRGAILWKPLTFADFEDDPTDPVPGHYRSDQLIRSYAPTSDVNVSFTTSTKPSFPSPNEQFLVDVGQPKVAEPNQLVLKSITHSALVKDGTEVLKQGATYPNGKIGMSFKFKPAILVNTLYAGLLQDILNAFRSLPTNVKFGYTKIGSLPQSAIDGAKVELNLAYSSDKTKQIAGCQGDSPEINEFDFHFLKNLLGQNLENANPSKKNISTSDSAKKLVNFVDEEFDLPVVASLPSFDALSEEEKKNIQPCQFAQAPTLYSVVSYNVSVSGVSVLVKYFNNKLPRGGGGVVFNPIAVVHGSLVGQAVADVRYGTVVETSGSVNIATVRNAIYENLKKKNVKITAKSPGAHCYLKNNSGTIVFDAYNFNNGYNCFQDMKTVTVGKETVLYFKNKNVHLNLSYSTPPGSSFTYKGKYVIISDGGNIFIDKDLYSTSPEGNSLVLVAMKDPANYDTTGHVYIAPCNANLATGPKNIQAAIFADGSLFPYTGDVSEINDKGEPEFDGNEERVYLSGCQLLIEGWVYSDNTIGGADLDKDDKDPKKYVLLGGGEVIKIPVSSADRLRAQYYDLNYLRLFTLDLEIAENGCPIDQSCGKGLCAEDIIKIDNNENVCGEYAAQFAGGVCGPVAKCNGINPFLKFTPGPNAKGDLVVKASNSVLAKGLKNTGDGAKDFDPVYIFQRDFAKGSFIFKK